ncbi:putative transcription factor bHLH family [Helianthus anomalus]
MQFVSKVFIISMALSYYTNWPENNTTGAGAANAYIFRHPSPAPEMFSFHEESMFIDTGINPIFDQTYDNFFPATIAGNVFHPSPEFQDPYSGLPYLSTFNQEHGFPVELPPVPEIGTFSGGGWYGGDGGGGGGLPPWYGEVEVKKPNEGGGGGGGSLSAQSMAARVRRRRISEKTQELGKLVPGGHRMNTAEMFQAAFKYIKFLQAQIGVLKLMPSIPESEEVMSNGEMQALVTCTSMQEKLYTAEKCIGPNTLHKASK